MVATASLTLPLSSVLVNGEQALNLSTSSSPDFTYFDWAKVRYSPSSKQLWVSFHSRNTAWLDSSSPLLNLTVVDAQGQCITGEYVPKCVARCVCSVSCLSCVSDCAGPISAVAVVRDAAWCGVRDVLWSLTRKDALVPSLNEGKRVCLGLRTSTANVTWIAPLASSSDWIVHIHNYGNSAATVPSLTFDGVAVKTTPAMPFTIAATSHVVMTFTPPVRHRLSAALTALAVSRRIVASYCRMRRRVA